MARQKLTAEEKAARATARKLARQAKLDAIEEQRAAARRAKKAEWHRRWAEAGYPTPAY